MKKKISKSSTNAKKSLTPKQFRDKWITALRSGRYKQTTGYLKDEHGYCCLGVACNIYNKHFDNKVKMVKYGSIFRFDTEEEILPCKVQKALSLASQNGAYKSDKLVASQLKSLAVDNDDGVSFKEIADIIESAPEGLFVSKAKRKTKKKKVKK